MVNMRLFIQNHSIKLLKRDPWLSKGYKTHTLHFTFKYYIPQLHKHMNGKAEKEKKNIRFAPHLAG